MGGTEAEEEKEREEYKVLAFDPMVHTGKRRYIRNLFWT